MSRGDGPARAGEPLSQSVAAASGLAGRKPVSDPRLDLVGESLPLCRGMLEFVRPRHAMDLIYEQNFDATEQYPPYWAELWPSGVELAYAVSGLELAGCGVLELGCGLGLPSIAAALGGARVLATDRSADAVAFTEANARRSATGLETRVCSWTDPGPIVDRAPWHLVLAADLLYGHRNVVELQALLPQLVTGAGEIWLADPGRPLAEEFLASARTGWESVTTAATRVPEVHIHRLRGPRPDGISGHRT